MLYHPLTHQAKILFGCGFLLLVSVGHSRTIYVTTSTTNPKSGTGTKTKPYTSLGHAASNATGGDLIYLKGGIHYPTTTDVLNCYSASAAAPLVIQSAPGEYATLDYKNVRGTIQDPAAGIYINAGCNYIRMSSFEVKNTQSFGINTAANYTTVDFCYIHAIGSSGIHVGGYELNDRSIGCQVNDNIVTDVMRENRGSDGRASGAVQWNGGIDFIHSSISKIMRNKVSFVFGEGILIQASDNAEICFNEVNDAYSQNYYIDNCLSISVHDNRSYSVWASNYYRDNLPANGIAITDENKSINANSRYIFVYSNTVSDTAIGFWYWDGTLPNAVAINPGLKDCRIFGNTFSRAVNQIIQIPYTPYHSDSFVFDNNYTNTWSSVVNIPSNISTAAP